MEKGSKTSSGKEKKDKKGAKGKKKQGKIVAKKPTSNIPDENVTKGKKEKLDTVENNSKPPIIADKRVPNGDEKEGVETLEMPETWGKKDIPTLVDKGFRSYVKNVKNRQYIILKKGSKVESLGRFSVGNWALLHKLFPKLNSPMRGDVPQGVPQDGFPQGEPVSTDTIDTDIGKNTKRKPHFTGIKMERPVVFPSKYVPTLKIMRFYEIYRSNGGTVEFTDFINEVVETHLRKCHGFLIDKLVYVME